MGALGKLVGLGGRAAGGAPLWLWVILLLAGVVVAQEGLRRVQTASLRADLAQAEATLATEREQASTAARETLAEYRRIEQRRATLALENERVIHQEKSTTSRDLAAGRTADDGVLRDIAAATRGGAPASDSGALARAEQRAAGLGELLGACRREATEDAGELEGLATQVRGLQRAYRSLDEGVGHAKDGDPPGPGARIDGGERPD